MLRDRRRALNATTNLHFLLGLGIGVSSTGIAAAPWYHLALMVWVRELCQDPLSSALPWGSARDGDAKGSVRDWRELGNAVVSMATRYTARTFGPGNPLASDPNGRETEPF